jgi:hypothetical protein
MNVSGCWEKKTKERFICRWLVAWESATSGTIAGAIAGYSGHAAFQVERFLAIKKAGKVAHFYFDFRDAVTDEEIEFDDKARKHLAVCESALDTLWEWNDSEEWNESDDVILRKGRVSELRRDGDLLFLSGKDEELVRQFCEFLGLTAGPT